jgi:hypothetical protein
MNDVQPVITTAVSEFAPILFLILVALAAETVHQIFRFFTMRHIDKVGFHDPELQSWADRNRDYFLRTTNLTLLRAIATAAITLGCFSAWGAGVWAWLSIWASSF